MRGPLQCLLVAWGCSICVAQRATECKDPRAINNNNTPNVLPDEAKCLYPVLRVDPYSWATL